MKHSHLIHEVGPRLMRITFHALRDRVSGQCVDRWQELDGHAWCGDLLTDKGDCESVDARKARRKHFTIMALKG
jgi:hypothetical protein